MQPVEPAGPADVPAVRLRDMTLANRVVVSPMATYSAQDGMPNDFHLVHLGSRALGGAGLVFTEMTCVTPEARITPGCAGMYSEAQMQAWKRIVDFVHTPERRKDLSAAWPLRPEGLDEAGLGGHGRTAGCGQLGGDRAMRCAWSPRNQVPRAMTRADMDRGMRRVRAGDRLRRAGGLRYGRAARAHGYLLSSFISPLTNRRTDEYGGSAGEPAALSRWRYSRAMRAAWPADKPMSVRISATDWVEGGITPDDAVMIARAFKRRGRGPDGRVRRADLGEAQPVYGRMFQTPFADRIRNEVGIATMAVGNITEPDHLNSIIAAGRADLCALARPHLSDPHFALHAAAELGYHEQAWPKQYLAGKAQLERTLKRDSDMAIII